MLAAILGLVLQDVLCVVGSPRAAAGPAPLACGWLEGGADARAPWRPVALGDGAAGVLVRTPLGAAVHAVLPAIAAGDHPLRRSRGRPAAPPASRLVCGGWGASFETAGCMLAFDPDGAVTVGGEELRPWPPALREGAWTVRESNPVRSVLVWLGPGATLYATVFAGVRAVELTLVVRLPPRGGAEVLGLEIGGAGGEEDAEDASESRPEEPPFDVVMEALGSSLWEPAPGSASGAAISVRRFGPTAPVTPAPPGRLLAIGPDEALAPGESRVLRVRAGDGAATADVIARPARSRRSASGETLELRRSLDAAVAEFRADPRHGLLHDRGGLGDWRMDSSRVGNLEWDTAHGLLVRWLATGARLDASQAIAGVEHLLLRDRDPASGLFFQHGREHQSGVVEPGHHWIEGVLAAAAWLCDPWLEDEARSLAASQVEAFEAMALPAALPRSLGWALTAACAAHPLAPDEARSRRLISKIERHVLARQSESGHFLLEPSTAREGAFRISPFVDGGILLPALERAARVTRNSATAGAVARAREALWRDGVVSEPAGCALVSSILVAPRTGRVISRAGRAEGEETVLFLSGVAGFGPPALEEGLLARASETLAMRDRVFLGKGISMLLRALPAYEARRRN